MSKRRNIIRLMLWGSYRRSFLKILFIFLLFLSSSLVGIIAALQFEKIQTYIVKKLAGYLSEKTGMIMKVEKARIDWFRNIHMEELTVYDTDHQRMIYAKELQARFQLFSLFKKNGIYLNNLVINGADVRIIKNAPDQSFNIDYFIFRIKSMNQKQEDGDKEKKSFEIKNISLSESFFTFSDPNKDTIRSRFNYNQFRLLNLQADLKDFKTKAGDLSMFIESLSLNDSVSGLIIQKYSGIFQKTDTTLVFDQTELFTMNSRLNLNLTFSYDSIRQFKYFVEKVGIQAKVIRAEIFSKDLGQFAEYFKPFNEHYNISGEFDGRIKNFDLKNFSLELGGITRIAGNLYMNGLPDIKSTFIDLEVRNSIVRAEDFKSYFDQQVLDRLFPLGHSSLRGSFTGFLKDFVADAVLNTQIGIIDTDINFKIAGRDSKANYTGKLITHHLNLGKVFNNEKLLQELDLNGFIEGSGLESVNADFILKADIAKFGFLNYEYKNIITDGRFTREQFDGFLSVNDSNLQILVNAHIFLGKGNEKVNGQANIIHANLFNLNLSPKPSVISSLIEADFNGLKIDELDGQVLAEKINFEYDHKTIGINNLHIQSTITGPSRLFTFSTDNLRINVEGSFNYSDVFMDIPRVLREYLVIANNDSLELADHLTIGSVNLPEYNLDFEVDLIDINPFLNLFIDHIRISPHTLFRGKIFGGRWSGFSVSAEIDTIGINNLLLQNNKLELSGRKKSNSDSLTARINFTSANQMNVKKRGSENFGFELHWVNDRIGLDLKIEQSSRNNKIDLHSNVLLRDNITLIELIPREILLLNKKWKVSENHVISRKGREIEIDQLSFSQDDQSVFFDGFISTDPLKALYIRLRNFNLANINPLISKEFGGMVQGNFLVLDAYKQPMISIETFIDSLLFQNFHVGDCYVSSGWEDLQKRFQVMLSIDKNNQEIINLTGQFYPLLATDQLNLSARLHHANINVIEPFYDYLISDLSGDTEGNFSIRGNLKSPEISGIGYIKNGTVSLDYLNTHYQFSGNVSFNPNRISFQNFNLYDDYNHNGSFAGTLDHQGFKNIRYNIRGNFQDLLMLNTSVKDNSLYYGMAFGSGSIHFTGQDKSLNIDINAISSSGTRFFIPLTGSSEVKQKEYIQFISLSDYEEKGSDFVVQTRKLKGIKMNFALEVTPDAYCEIIFDPLAGDIIRGRGNGKINMQIDTEGDFTMFGDYEITEGAYNFTLYNVINKAFAIEPGSLITWSGDPYQANLNLTANYSQNVSLGPLFLNGDTTFQQNPEVRRRYPTTVELILKGPLMSPEINFDIDITDYPRNLVIEGVSFETAVSAFKTDIQADEQELKRQVFSLIVLRKFAEKGTFSVSNSFGNSVSEFVSNQLSYWISQLDENLVVDLDLGTLDPDAMNAFQLRMSYSLADGRFRITRAGNIYSEQAGNDLSTVIGDWTLEYLLTRDGNLRAKMYNRFNYNAINGTTEGNTTSSAGFSLMHTQSFDKFADLFRRKNRKNRNKTGDYILYDEGTLPSTRQNEDQEE